MHIQLKNIGIISDSSIEIKGLTVITGHNNSGKTTVGKVLYSLIDAVSDLEEKAAEDKYSYALEQLGSAARELSCREAMKYGAKGIDDESIRIFFSGDYVEQINRDNVELFLEELIKDIDKFSLKEEPYKTIFENYEWSLFFDETDEEEEFGIEKARCVEILQETYKKLTRDPKLISYARQSIGETLSKEFMGQIQPAALNNVFSKIEMLDGKKMCFSMEIYDNAIVETSAQVFNWMPYENTYLIDNPFIVGDNQNLFPLYYRNRTRYTKEKNSYLNGNHILSHEDKVKLAVNRPENKTVFETSIIEESYKNIKAKIDEILPGEIAFTNEGQYYVQDGVKVKASNLATGSKMFSIIKVLLSKGKITKRTLLILDEPEAHLHPEWQNLFAEVMILLIKEVGCHILLTTHSPNFMLALEANMRKYEVQNLCDFYQTKHIKGTEFVDYRCVNDSLEDIYEDFVKYLSDMKSVRDSYW